MPLVSRRGFLAASTAGLLTPWRSLKTAISCRAPSAPSDRLTLALIGLKKMGSAHLDALLKYPGVQILAVCDVDTTTREAALHKVEQAYAARAAEQSSKRDGKYAGIAAYNEYERILARPDIDAVLIATPEHWHARMAIDACRAGKDVYCEKPLAQTIRDARAIADAARLYGRVFQTGTQQRSAPEFRFACELVRSGYIGEVTSVHVEVGPPSTHVELPAEPVPPGFDYDRWLGPAPFSPYNRLRVGSYYEDGWRRIRDYSGGKMTDWGAHHFDIVQWGLGMDASGPVEIIPPPPDAEKERAFLAALASGRKLEGPLAGPADPSWGLKYRYVKEPASAANSGAAHGLENGVASGVINEVELIKDHTNGILFVGTEGKIEVNRGHLQTWPENLKKVKLRPTDVHLHDSPGHYEDWFACIRTRREPICPPHVTCRSVSVCHLGNIALWLGRPLRWDPQREEFINDDAANRWLARPAREFQNNGNA